MERWVALWNRYWFPTASPLNLAGARIVTVAAQLFWFFPALDHHIGLATKNTEFIDPQPIIRLIDAVLPRELVFSPGSLTAIYWVTVLAGVLALIGLFTRTSLFVLALGVWFFVSHAYSYADVHHPQALFAIFLMLLPLSPAGERLSVDALLRRRRGRPTREATDTAMWPLKLLHVLLALTYFSTGITKLISGGLAWMNGYTLQRYLFSDAISANIPVGIWMAQQYWLCVALSVGTILFEVFYFVSIPAPRTRPLFFVGAIFFHLGLYATSGHPFFPHMVMNAVLLLFLHPTAFPSLVRRPERGLPGAPAGEPAA